MANFSEYNQRLAELLTQDELAITDLGTVHELTYTLENALNRPAAVSPCRGSTRDLTERAAP